MNHPLLFNNGTYIFSCNDGWFYLINNLCDNLEGYITEFDISIHVDQVKEKFGGLRFYYSITMGDSWKENKFYSIVRKIANQSPNWLRSKAYHYLSNHIYTKSIESRKVTLQYVDDKIQDIVNNAETYSYLICEDCGMTGATQTSGGWISSLCKDCAECRNIPEY